MESQNDVLLLRSRDWWRAKATKAVADHKEALVSIAKLEDAFGALHAYAKQLCRIRHADPAEREQYIAEMDDLCLREIAEQKQELAFGSCDGGTQTQRDTVSIAMDFKAKVDYYRGLTHLCEILGLSTADTTLMSAVKLVEALKKGHEQSQQLILEELSDGNI